MTFAKKMVVRYTSGLVILLSFFVISILAENVQDRMYLNMIVTILLFAVIPASFCYLRSCAK
ncbi:MAG: hypothetical protein ACE5FT_07580 [Candidatus Nanoarchaeia archaeon]